MARRSPLETLLVPRAAALLDALPSALEGDARGIHRARVASRRVREVLPVLAETLEAAALARARKTTRRVTRALGPVRELDVAIAHFDECVQAHGADTAAATAVMRAMSTTRASALRDARLALPPARLVKLRAALDLNDATVSAHAARAALMVSSALDARLAQRADGVRQAVGEVGILYVPDRLHAVRIAVKQLRYASEAVGELRRGRVSARVSQLRALQDLLGRAHDLHVLSDRLRGVQTNVVRTSRRTAREVGRLAGVLDQECRELHAAFLGRRPALLALCEALVPHAAPPRARSAA